MKGLGVILEVFFSVKAVGLMKSEEDKITKSIHCMHVPPEAEVKNTQRYQEYQCLMPAQEKSSPCSHHPDLKTS